MEMYPDHVYSFQELLDYLDKCLANNDTLVSDFKHMIEDAKQHRAHKKISKIQISLLASKEALSEYVDDKVASSGIVFSSAEPHGVTKWEKFPCTYQEYQRFLL